MKKVIALSLTLLCAPLSFSKNALDTQVSFSQENYEILSFSSIKPNTYSFNGSSLSINVGSSAAPLIYPFSTPKIFKKLRFTAKQTGKLNLKKFKQGAKGNDDFALKIGLVFEGDKKLNFFQRTIAATWIKKLYSLAPKGTGISKIHFYTVYQDTSLKDTSRQHPLSDLLFEEYVARANENGDIEISVDIAEQKKVLALWISADGDDTHSNYKMDLTSITLSE